MQVVECVRARSEHARAPSGMRTSCQRMRRMITSVGYAELPVCVYKGELDPGFRALLSSRCARSVLRVAAPWTSYRTFSPSRVVQAIRDIRFARSP